MRPVAVQHEIERVLAPLEVDYDLEVYKSLLGHEGKGVEPLVQSMEAIHEYLFGEKLRHERPDRASIWTDTNVYNELGIPAVKVRAARPPHWAEGRRAGHRRHGEGCAGVRARRAGHLQPRAACHVTRATVCLCDGPGPPDRGQNAPTRASVTDVARTRI